MPARRLDIQDFLVVAGRRRAVRRGDRADGARSIAAAGAIMAERGRRSGVADEGGWWPEFALQRGGARHVGARRSSAPASSPATTSRIASTSPRRNSARQALSPRCRAARARHAMRWSSFWPAGAGAIRSSRSRIRVAEDDDGGHARLHRARVGDRIQVIGDDYLVTSARRVTEAAARGALQCGADQAEPGGHDHRDQGRARRGARRQAGAPSSPPARAKPRTSPIVHLAVGWDAGQLKVGSFARSERMAKWNEALRIEDALGRIRPLRQAASHEGGTALSRQSRASAAARRIGFCDRHCRGDRRRRVPARDARCRVLLHVLEPVAADVSMPRQRSG